MIFYFSATGNSKRAAERIAQETGDTNLISMGTVMRTAETNRNQARFRYTLAEDEQLGIVSPVYCWGLPSVVNEFLSLVTIDVLDPAQVYSFCVITYGTTTGKAGHLVAEHLQRQRITLSARFSVRCPDTFTPLFDLSDKRKVARMVARSEQEITSVAGCISIREQGDFMRRTTPRAIASVYWPFYQHERKCRNLSVNTALCVGCGACAKRCPCAAIEMRGEQRSGRRPVWVKKRCAMCLRCLHCCPAHAIQFGSGRATNKHGQYRNPHTRV